MATQPFKYKNAEGSVITADFDVDYGLRPELDSETREWAVIATDPVAEEQTDFAGALPKK